MSDNYLSVIPPHLDPRSPKDREEVPVGSSAVPAAVVQSVPPPRERAKGPWGRLHHSPFFLEAPAHLLQRFPLPNPKPRWFVNAGEAGPVMDRLSRSGLPQDIVHAINQPSNRAMMGDQLVLFPPVEGLVKLTGEIRAAVYRELSRFALNVDMVGPVLIPKDEFETWFEGTSLRPELRDLIKQMSYKRGEAIAFSDTSVLIGAASGESEAREVVSILSRTRALVLKLSLDQNSKIKDIADYWSTGEVRRTKPNYAPFLKALLGANASDKLDVVHLLPPLARKLLYTYPDLSSVADGEMPDCHWSSLNFFKYQEEPFFLDSRLASSAILERFQPVKSPYRFGDILIFLDQTAGNAYHSCVYIADDVVFTKNGRNILSPWVLQSLAHVKMTYLYNNNGRIQGYRAKGIGA
jgi:hypothetical protein